VYGGIFLGLLHKEDIRMNSANNSTFTASLSSIDLKSIVITIVSASDSVKFGVLRKHIIDECKAPGRK
jgi:hypothetical protein